MARHHRRSIGATLENVTGQWGRSFGLWDFSFSQVLVALELVKQLGYTVRGRELLDTVVGL